MQRLLNMRAMQTIPVGILPAIGFFLLTVLSVLLGKSFLGGLGVALAVPGIWALARLLNKPAARLHFAPRDPASGLLQRPGIITALDGALLGSASGRTTTASIVLEIDDFKLVEERFERAAIERLYAELATRLRAVVRENDSVGRLEGPVFAVALAPVRRLDLEAAIQLCTRLQQTISHPISMGASNIYLTASVGFCLAGRLDGPTGDRLLQAASTAMIESQRGGRGAIRGYSEAMRSRIKSRNSLSAQVSRALDNGEIRAFFQPQVATADRALSGFEALARWEHPERGLIPPTEFLPALEQAGLMEELGQQMVGQALAALRLWDGLGHNVPQVAVNFSTEELRNPGLVDKIAFALDHYGMTPARLTVEVLETVVAGRAEDQVIHNLAGLSQLGCLVDLDDFGTGHASITNIRRFSIARIKIDRSFVARIDKDADQQMMFAAILTMADRLGLDSLAEGVETEGELAMLTELGCRHAQGYAIARPMPLDDTTRWIAAKAAQSVLPLARRVG